MSEPRAVGEGRSGYPCPCGCPFTGHPASHMVSSDLQRKKSIKGGPFSIPLCFSHHLTFISPVQDS